MYDLAHGVENEIPFVLVDASGSEVIGVGSAFTVELRESGGVFIAGAGSKSEVGGGWYLYTATADECGVSGALALRITAAGAAQQNLVYRIVPFPLVAQDVANAVSKLAPAAGAPAAGSVGAHLDTLIDATTAIKAITDDLDLSNVTQVVANKAGHLTVTAGLTFREVVSGLTIPADWKQSFWTLKAKVRDLDSSAVVQLVSSNPSDPEDGVVYVNASDTLPAGISVSSGTLSVSQPDGEITIFLEDDLTVLLGPATNLGWDVKFIDASGDSVGWRGTADICLTETQAV